MANQLKDILDRLTRLEEVVFGNKEKPDSKLKIPNKKGRLDFSLNERAFLKKYFFKFNGQQTFALICAALSKGKTDTPINLSGIKKTWKNCQGIIKYPYSSIYSTRAKENNWVVPGNKATYSIRPSWIEIFN